MFDKKEPDEDSYYFQLLTDSTEVGFWCDRLKALPKFVLENAVARIPVRIDPPNADERWKVVEFLDRRKSSLFDDIQKAKHRFPHLVAG